MVKDNLYFITIFFIDKRIFYFNVACFTFKSIITHCNCDIFIDNNLVISKSGIIPLIDIDSLTVGENRGINGGICNVTYFKKPLSVGNMFILYHSIKYKNPPVTDISLETVIESI